MPLLAGSGRPLKAVSKRVSGNCLLSAGTRCQRLAPRRNIHRIHADALNITLIFHELHLDARLMQQDAKFNGIVI